MKVQNWCVKIKAPSRLAWGLVKNPSFSQTRDRHSKGNIFDLVPDQIFDAGARRAQDICAESNSFGDSVNTLRMPAVMARRRSVSMLTFVQPTRRATSISGSGTPWASGILPPYLLISSTRYFGTLDAPCSTSG